MWSASTELSVNFTRQKIALKHENHKNNSPWTFFWWISIQSTFAIVLVLRIFSFPQICTRVAFQQRNFHQEQSTIAQKLSLKCRASLRTISLGKQQFLKVMRATFSNKVQERGWRKLTCSNICGIHETYSVRTNSIF